jgi:hypothetical protein
VGGFALIGRNARWGGILIGLSLALKPIVILLPLALLLRRDTRKAGIWSIATAGAANVAGLAFLAWRAGDARVLNPLIALGNFSAKTYMPVYACAPENYSPSALLCRLGLGPSQMITGAIAIAVAGLGYYWLRRLGDLPGRSWEVFALACMLSPFIGPVAWSHYQLLLAPAMLVLAYGFWRRNAPPMLWAALVLVFALCELIWDPLESLAHTPVVVLIVSYTLGQLAQYFLLLGWLWFLRLRAPHSASAPSARAASRDASPGAQAGFQ